MKTNKEAKMFIGKKSSKQKVMSVLSNWQLYVMVLPAVIYLLIFAYKPMYGLIIAFKDFKFKLGIAGSEWAGLENFERLVTSYWFPIILKNTLTISLLGLVIGFPIPIIFALLVNELKGKRIGNLVKTVSYAPHFISTIVMCGLVMHVFGVEAEGTDIDAGKLNHQGYISVAQQICQRFGCKKVAITLRGSISANDNDWAAMLYCDGEAYFSPTYRVHIVDRVGGGDSFGGGLIYALLAGKTSQETINYAVAASCLKYSIEHDFNLVSVSEVEALAGGNASGRVQR